MLNKEQQCAVNNILGQQIIVACPGSGKTTVLLERIKKMLDSGIKGRHILVITFTKQAAQELSIRFFKKYGRNEVFFGTIHSVCFRVVQKAYGYHKDSILTGLEQYMFFYHCLKNKPEIETDNLEHYIQQMISEISYVRNSEIPLKEFMPEHSKKHIFDKMFDYYEQYKKGISKVDFDDLVILCRKCFMEQSEELAYWQSRFLYIMVDEFQDTNQQQADIFYMLAGENGNICVVGDDDQSIYHFRGANPRVMFHFSEKYKEAAVIKLSTNYRSEPEIIEAAANLISQNKNRFSKEFKAAKTGKGVIQVTKIPSLVKQAACVIEKIEKQHTYGIRYDEMAVLYRTNIEAQMLYKYLLDKNIPYYTKDPPRNIYKNPIFEDIKSYWRLANGREQRGDLQRILNRPSRYLKSSYFKNCYFNKNQVHDALMDSGKSDVDAWIQTADMIRGILQLKDKCPADFMKVFLNMENGYENYLMSYAEFMKKDPEEDLEVLHCLNADAAGFSSMEEWFSYAQNYEKNVLLNYRKRKKEGVCLSTFHSAKGLEWESVYLISCNDEVTPHKKAKTDEELEEERRMFYVAVTRAKKYLSVYYVEDIEHRNPSPFIREMVQGRE